MHPAEMTSSRCSYFSSGVEPVSVAPVACTATRQAEKFLQALFAGALS